MQVICHIFVAHSCARVCGIARERDLIIVTTAALSMALKLLSLGTGDVILIEDSTSSDAGGVEMIVGSSSVAAATPPRFGTRPCELLLAPAVYISTCDPRVCFHRFTNAPLAVTFLASVAIVLPAVATVLILMIPALLLELA